MYLQEMQRELIDLGQVGRQVYVCTCLVHFMWSTVAFLRGTYPPWWWARLTICTSTAGRQVPIHQVSIEKPKNVYRVLTLIGRSKEKIGRRRGYTYVHNPQHMCSQQRMPGPDAYYSYKELRSHTPSPSSSVLFYMQPWLKPDFLPVRIYTI